MRRAVRSILAVAPSSHLLTSCLAAPWSSGSQRRWQTRVPSKGYRQQSTTVPDRIKDTVAIFGSDTRTLHSEEDPPYVPEQQRREMLQEVMSSSKNLKTLSKMDRLRTALDAVRGVAPGDDKWKEVYMFLRTTEMCSEVVANESDVFPVGSKLWIELQLCEEKRVPVLLKLPNGMPVLPIFSLEEYQDEYFGRTDSFDSCWFPVPRGGSRWEEFCKLPFPVCVTGELQHFSTLATVALGTTQLAMFLNPGQRTSKFITYPEMVHLARMKTLKSKDRNLSLKRTITSADGRRSEEEWIFDLNLMTTFDTRNLHLTRLEPQDLEKLLAERPPIPPVAQQELHLLLHLFPEIASVYIRTVPRPRWRTMLGASPTMTQIDVVCKGTKKPDPKFFAHLQRWSFMKEFNSDVHVELASQVPVQAPGDTNAFMCVYTAADGASLRSMATYTGVTLAEELGYNTPIKDQAGNEPYEPFTSYL